MHRSEQLDCLRVQEAASLCQGPMAAKSRHPRPPSALCIASFDPDWSDGHHDSLHTPTTGRTCPRAAPQSPLLVLPDLQQSHPPRCRHVVSDAPFCTASLRLPRRSHPIRKTQARRMPNSASSWSNGDAMHEDGWKAATRRCAHNRGSRPPAAAEPGHQHRSTGGIRLGGEAKSQAKTPRLQDA